MVSRKQWVGLICLAVFAVSAIWLSLGVYQSHYLSALRMLGDASTENIVGTPKEGRGDEWATYLPLLKQDYREGFPARSSLAPYDERLQWFISLPHADLSLLFLPNQAAYWLVPGGTALSFQGLYYNLLLIASLVWLLRNLRVRLSLAVPVAFAVAFSHLYQVWWTSNFPALAACFLPFAVFTSGLKPPWKFLALFWSIGHVLFGQMYPPFYISLAAALVPFVLAVRPDLFTVRTLALAALASAAGLAVYAAVEWDFVKEVMGTTYPGRRFNLGGGSSFSTLMGMLLPTYPAQITPTSAGDFYELSVVGAIFPLMLLGLFPRIRVDHDAVRVSLVFALTALVLVIYARWGFSPLLARLTGFYMMPGRRAQFGLSILVILYAAYMLSRYWNSLAPLSLLLATGGYALVAWFVPMNANVRDAFMDIRFYPYLPVLLVLAGLLISLGWRDRSRRAGVVAMTLASGMALAQVFVFGSFNPLMHAGDIMRPVDSQFVRDWKVLYRMNGDKPLAIVGNYGHVLRGEGLPALQAIHLANVEESRYASLFPYLSPGDIHTGFNQFRGIAFENVAQPHIEKTVATAVFPVRPHAVSFAHDARSGEPTAAGNLLHDPPTATVTRDSGNVFTGRWEGVLSNPLDENRRLALQVPCPVVDSWLTRYPLSWAGRPEHTAALQGLAGELKVNAGSEAEAAACIARMTVGLANP